MSFTSCRNVQGRPDPTEALTINPGAEVSDPRLKHAGAAAPTPSSVRYPSRDDVAESDMSMAPTPAGQGPVSMDTGYAEVRQAKLPCRNPAAFLRAADCCWSCLFFVRTCVVQPLDVFPGGVSSLSWNSGCGGEQR